jgi:hypothetical protein
MGNTPLRPVGATQSQLMAKTTRKVKLVIIPQVAAAAALRKVSADGLLIET